MLQMAANHDADMLNHKVAINPVHEIKRLTRYSPRISIGCTTTYSGLATINFSELTGSKAPLVD